MDRKLQSKNTEL